jgi:hypothetical protein
MATPPPSIDSEYRQLALWLHPDKGGDRKAFETLGRIREKFAAAAVAAAAGLAASHRLRAEQAQTAQARQGCAQWRQRAESSDRALWVAQAHAWDLRGHNAWLSAALGRETERCACLASDLQGSQRGEAEQAGELELLAAEKRSALRAAEARAAELAAEKRRAAELSRELEAARLSARLSARLADLWPASRSESPPQVLRPARGRPADKAGSERPPPGPRPRARSRSPRSPYRGWRGEEPRGPLSGERRGEGPDRRGQEPRGPHRPRPPRPPRPPRKGWD